MTQELFFRTEDLRPDEVSTYFVETSGDRAIIDALKGRSPVLLRGSRGVGKSFLLRVAEAEMKASFHEDRVLPVYLTFARAGLINQQDQDFLPWMTSKIANSVQRAITSYGLQIPDSSSLAQLIGGSTGNSTAPSMMEKITAAFEQFWAKPDGNQSSSTPPPEEIKDAIEQLCDEIGVRRIALLVDEAAHVFIPEQQRQFFTLMRDLRSPYLSVKAAVYPGATSYGESFQPTHDASVLDVERPVTETSYAPAMREIVFKQDPSREKDIDQHGEAFDTLAFAATGNPRILLKTLNRRTPLRQNSARETIREYYRDEIWAEHSTLSERYPGHSALIDWGRDFLEGEVLPAVHARNQRETQMCSAIWIHRDAPQIVREALKLLCYSGILQEGVSGIRATRSEVGTRYMINVGCNLAQDGDPLVYGLRLRRTLSKKRMLEFGANHAAYRSIENISLESLEKGQNAALNARLASPIDCLDLTHFQKQNLTHLKLVTIGDVLSADEELFKTRPYVGDVRARQMRNAAITAVIEYLSG
ncbi:Uncharacterised protein [Mycobacteroides abscessus subsp. bolletii]|uniref:ORC-CDC6 family AAA ATPase n=1 Tax=Mycobacteroides abscessus TaxID=36809 RepID=UPI0009D0F639|nr:hypothetical protein [Mycobacteroides abscessus]SKG74558.1 Uncharacterised protein [Mycobacteroides abscessus subsp. bolletii]SLF42246.1 Uncharacterised protein [Mycobacteroides abscessus subsp. bolletii]